MERYVEEGRVECPVHERFHMFEDTIRDTWVYQEIGKDFFEKGIEKGELRALRQTLLAVVRERFPDIEAAAQQRVEEMEIPAQIQQLIVRMSTAQTLQDAALLTTNEQTQTH
jgi:hypothetical protein